MNITRAVLLLPRLLYLKWLLETIGHAHEEAGEITREIANLEVRINDLMDATP